MPSQAVTLGLYGQNHCNSRFIMDFQALEGAGADPSQRTGTRLGGVVSSRDCRVVLASATHNTVNPVFPR